jgi:hypothetical protein
MLKLVIFLISYYITCPLAIGLETFVKHHKKLGKKKRKQHSSATQLCADILSARGGTGRYITAKSVGKGQKGLGMSNQLFLSVL